jgi:CheY-like chemotaxis protein
MALTCLLVCAEGDAVRVLKSVLQELSIEVEYCIDPVAAQARIDASAYDVLLVDCQDEASTLRLMAHARSSTGNSSAVIIAMVNLRNRVPEVFASGADFILYKPISRERTAEGLRAAREMVQRERRAHPRIPLQAIASIDYAGAEEVSVELLDLSETGLSFRCGHPLPTCCRVYLQFSVPGDPKLVRLSGEVMWQESSGKVGLRFASVPQTSKRILEGWLKTSVTASASSEPGNVLQTETLRIRLSTGLGLVSPSLADRRTRSRHSCCVGADVYRLGSDVPHRCNLTDVSNGGCYIETSEPQPVGTQLEIVVWAQGIKVMIEGNVHSSNLGFGMGVKFVLRTDEDRRHVEQLIECVRTEPKLS